MTDLLTKHADFFWIAAVQRKARLEGLSFVNQHETFVVAHERWGGAAAASVDRQFGYQAPVARHQGHSSEVAGRTPAPVLVAAIAAAWIIAVASGSAALASTGPATAGEGGGGGEGGCEGGGG